MEVGARHIVPAIGVAALLHLLVLIAVFWSQPNSGAIGAGRGGLEISMGAAGGAPGMVTPDAPDSAEVETSDAAEDVAPDAARTVESAEAPDTETETAETFDVSDPPLEVAEPVVEAAEAVEARPVSAEPAREAVERVLLETRPVIPRDVTAQPVVPQTLTAELAAVETVPVETLPPPQVELQPEPEIPAVESVEIARAEPARPVEAVVQEVAETEVVRTVATQSDTAETVEAEEVLAAVDPDAVVAPLPRARPADVPRVREQPRRTEPRRTRPRQTEPRENQPRRQPQRTETPATPNAEREREPPQQAARSGGDVATERQETRGAGNAGAAGNASSAGQGQRATGGGDPGALRDYQARIAALLERNKRYPRRAERRRQQGIGQLFFVIRKDGSVGVSRLAQSTGHDLLDEEILTILSRVGRFPPIPDEIGVAELPIQAPIRFQTR
ncbi:MAG: TonB family protein [Pseudomonadota bacterium]